MRVIIIIKKMRQHHAISGVCPDGAADGQAALADVEEVGEKVDTCDLHRLQARLPAHMTSRTLA